MNRRFALAAWVGIALMANCVPASFEFPSEAGDGGNVSDVAIVDAGGEQDSSALSAPVVQEPSPPDGATFAPTRVTLAWSSAPPSSPVDLYFVLGSTVPPNLPPYRSAITGGRFVVQADTDGLAEWTPDPGVTPIALVPSTTYAWKACVRDGSGRAVCTATRTLNTDDSVHGWWRFDQDPNGPACTAAAPGRSVCDSSDKGNHGAPGAFSLDAGSFPGTVGWAAPDASPGLLGGAALLDGSVYVDVPYDPSLDVATAGVTVSCRFWMQPGVWGSVLQRDYPLMGPYAVVAAQIDAGAVMDFSLATSNWNSVYVIDDSGAGLSGRFVRGTGRYDGTTLSVVEGSLATASPPMYAGDAHANSNDLRMGLDIAHLVQTSGAEGFFAGAIDECILFDRPLDDREVANLALADPQ
jgi:hypothetical protein